MNPPALRQRHQGKDRNEREGKNKKKCQSDTCLDLEQFQQKWVPILCPELRENRELEPLSDSMKSKTALENEGREGSSEKHFSAANYYYFLKSK